MDGSWTFGRKIAAGFALGIASALIIGLIAVITLQRVVDAKDRVISVDAQILIDAEQLNGAIETKVSATRGYFLSGQASSLAAADEARREFLNVLERLKRAVYAESSRKLLAEIERNEQEHERVVARVAEMRRANAPMERIVEVFEREAVPKRSQLRQDVVALIDGEAKLLADAKQAASDNASSASVLIMTIAGGALLVVIVFAVVLTRTLTRQIGAAVQHVQSSSAELQTAANQQATGAKEQATAMNEITTTISELLATSRQIAESAQRVARIAVDTVQAAKSGERSLSTANESIVSIRRQVDLIVTHMLELGRKSQQIGGILDIINELADQTNILAINATIEAAGAGEHGKRFGVVADEIRKLADRVGLSTKEIRTLIDEIRAAVNTTVMTTEAGSKAVDAGSRQFTEVNAGFAEISNLVGVTTEAAREIELSTKQQSTAVEQVNLAVSNVAQATRETEASSSQTLQTAGQLSGLARELMRLVQPERAA